MSLCSCQYVLYILILLYRFCARCFFLLLSSLTCFVLLKGYEYLLVDVQHDSNICPRVESYKYIFLNPIINHFNRHPIYTPQNVYSVKDGHITQYIDIK